MDWINGLFSNIVGAYSKGGLECAYCESRKCRWNGDIEYVDYKGITFYIECQDCYQISTEGDAEMFLSHPELRESLIKNLNDVLKELHHVFMEVTISLSLFSSLEAEYE